MTEHTHQWAIDEPFEKAVCITVTCNKELDVMEIVRRLNEHANLESQIDAMRDFMALLYLGIREGRDEAFEALDDKTKHLINEVWFERLEED